jgi:hypothetical protein
VTDDGTIAPVDPYTRLLGDRRVREQNDLVARSQAGHTLPAFAENGAMDRGEEMLGVLGRQRWNSVRTHRREYSRIPGWRIQWVASSPVLAELLGVRILAGVAGYQLT